jgi:hypothetical protein
VGIFLSLLLILTLRFNDYKKEENEKIEKISKIEMMKFIILNPTLNLIFIIVSIHSFNGN